MIETPSQGSECGISPTPLENHSGAFAGIMSFLIVSVLASLVCFRSSPPSRGPLPDVHDCDVTGVKLGATQQVVETLKLKPLSRNDLGDGRYELMWKDGTAVCFDSASKIVIEVSGPGLSVAGKPVIRKGMNSADVTARIEPLEWPAPTVVGPENHSWTSQPPSSMYYCNFRYHLQGGTCSVHLLKDAVELVSLTVDP